MNQVAQRQPWWNGWRDNWPILALVALMVAITTITGLGYWQRWSWTGLVDIQDNPGTRPFWDWLDLLIIPIVLAAGAFWFNQQARKVERELAGQERENDRQIATDRAREDALQSYLDRLSELVLDKNLRDSDTGAVVRDVARARTLAVLRSLDGDRKGQVVKFLYEADLIGSLRKGRVIEAIIDLRGADLSGANLIFTDLSGANLSSANLKDANLSFTSLERANLVNAYMGGSILRSANLVGANLSHASLIGAEEWTNEQLAQAESLFGAILPDVRMMSGEDWEEFQKLYRK